ncbi:hypothetical protein MOG60_023440, partial [Escherichia coli]|nr:hypothetical protein [Escherichia coli]
AAAFARGTRGRVPDGTEAARPDRSLKAGGLPARDGGDSPKPRKRVRRRLAGAPAAACRVRA